MLADRAVAVGFEITLINAHYGVPESIAGYDALLVMGAVPSVNDAAIQSWFQPEIDLIRDADRNGVPVFGVCFGAQALAVALGGSVTRASDPEIGWFTMETNDPETIPLGPFFEWHVDAISPPPNATILARTSVCVQAFRIGKHLAVQFHPEVTTIEIGEWVENDAKVLEALGLSGTLLLEQAAIEFPAARDRANKLFDQFLAIGGLRLDVHL